MRLRPNYTQSRPSKRGNWRVVAPALASISLVIAVLTTVEIGARQYLIDRNPYAVSPLFYRAPDNKTAPTNNKFDAVDPQLGYAHPRGSTVDLKAWGTAYEPGFGVHRPKLGAYVSIYVLGGSTSDPYLAIGKRHHPWTYHLYNECRSNGYNCGIWNGGIGGFGTPQEIIKMVRDVMPARPDLIIGLHGPNELNRHKRSPFTMGFQRQQMARLADDGSIWMGGLLPNVFTFLSISKTGDDRPFAPAEVFYGVQYDTDPFERWATNVAMMNGIAQSQGSVFRTVLQPIVGFGRYNAEPELLNERSTTYFEKVRDFYHRATEFCRSVDYCIDLSGVFDGKSGLFDDARHPNDTGNKIIAKELSHRLIKDGILNYEPL